MKTNPLYTIGYAPHSLETFRAILQKHNISAIADVRSSPYSQFKPEFNREGLKRVLMDNGIGYVFLGDLCGARAEDPGCYIEGKVDFALLAMTESFKAGIDRIVRGTQTHRIALMCAEKDPISCHRFILICRRLPESIDVKHILPNSELESHGESELRLLKLHKLHHPDMFADVDERLHTAYTLQGQKIAYEA